MVNRKIAFKKILLNTGLFLLGVFLFILFFLVESDVPLEQLKDKYTYDNSEFVDVDGMNVHYRRSGEGFPVVLIHGTGASLHTWDGWTRIIKDSFEVISMDLPAFGLTGPNPQRDYSIQAYVDFINDFTNTIGLDSFHLGGNSLGGKIAWSFTSQHPEKVDKLILVDAAGYPDSTSHSSAISLARNPIFGPLLKYITPRSFVEKNLRDVISDPMKVTEELVTRYHELARRPGNRQAFIDRAKTTYIDESIRIPLIKNSTLILWGSEDTWTDLNHAYHFEKDIERSGLIVYDGVGHIPMEEIPAKSGKDVLRFLLKKEVDF